MSAPLAFFKLRANHKDYEAALTKLREAFAEVKPGNLLSVNVNKDGTFAWVKAPSDVAIADAVLVTTEPEANKDAVRAEVSSEAWTGPIPKRPGVPKP